MKKIYFLIILLLLTNRSDFAKERTLYTCVEKKNPAKHIMMLNMCIEYPFEDKAKIACQGLKDAIVSTKKCPSMGRVGTCNSASGEKTIYAHYFKPYTIEESRYACERKSYFFFLNGEDYETVPEAALQEKEKYCQSMLEIGKTFFDNAPENEQVVTCDDYANLLEEEFNKNPDLDKSLILSMKLMAFGACKSKMQSDDFTLLEKSIREKFQCL